MKRERFNLACFLSQQAAEKTLKAFLIANKKEPWGHSVAELCEKASLNDKDFKNIKKRAATLDIYYIPQSAFYHTFFLLTDDRWKDFKLSSSQVVSRHTRGT